MVFEEIEDVVSEIDKKEAERDAAAYRIGYKKLFNGIDAVIKNTHTYEQTIAALKHLHVCAEEHFIEFSEEIE